MRIILTITAILAIGMLSAGALLAQEPEEARLGTASVTQVTILRDQPSPTGKVVQILKPGTNLLWINGKRVNGFLYVVAPKGPRGWVAESKAQIVTQPPDEILLTAAGPPCKNSLASCSPTGCANSGTAQGLFNETKRRIPAETTPVTLSFDDFAILQEHANELVGQGADLGAEDRATLTGLAVSEGSVQEGSLVRLVGFIANGGGAKAPHANTGESVNCRLTQAKNNDFHISLTPAANHTEFDGIVAEMIPQDRPAGWTLSKLASIKTLGRRVMVVGALFYDNKHVVNDDPEQPTGGDPKRFSLWEIHPVTKFFVCRKANNACDPNTAGDWKPLEDF